ncbi:uncharacterized protein LOC121267679 isoform X1 [Juglans microcarpa x Juglans regia]|uniref:uncharacterized protein LOC121267679 isoform X1 n=1 Tax=Juglans microcarpa x Juglans regia TaxID=2249226 RepID=UPI001B7F37AF|nr:uncharacterized protein LOC121267679 isoform X1 [Juglans microcarpa x Juglans regia]
MNRLLASNKEKAEKVSCYFCKKVFNNYQDLEAHLRAHQEEINGRKSSNYPAHFSNFMDIVSTIPNSISMVLPGSSFHRSGNKLSKLFLRTTSPLEFSKFCLNELSRVHATVSMPSAPSSFGDALMNFQHHSFSNFSDPACATSLPDSGLGSNLLHGLKEYTAVGSFPPGHGPCSGQTGVGKYDKSSVNPDMMNSSKGPQISSSLPAETEEPQKNEPLPFIEKEEIERLDILKDVEDSFSELGISFYDKE